MRNSTDSDRAQPNLTPMLDVVFIMLIFFMVTATFVTEHGIDVTAPEPRPHPPPIQKHRDILVRIAPNDQLVVQGRLSDPRAIRAHLLRLFAEQPEASVVIDAHPDSTSGTLVLVMDTARSIGAPLRLTE